ncbi:MAG: ABC transporter permease [Candidatus Korobacteraceae bacterium]
MRLSRFFRRRDQDADLAQELDAHLRHEMDDYVAQGLPVEEAARRAHLTLGSTVRIREDLWSWNSFRPLEGFLRDLSYAARTLSRTPGFAIMAILVMALGIGANTALFTVVHSVLLKPLPFADPNSLVMLYERSFDVNYPFNVIAPGVYAEWQKHAQSFERMAIFGSNSYNLSGVSGQLPEKIEAARVSAEFFPTLGVRSAYGRTFDSSDDRPQTEATVVLSWGLWKRRYGGDTSIIGRDILLDAKPYTVIGIMPAWFVYPDVQTQMWTAFHHEIPPQDLVTLDSHSFSAIARLKSGVTLPQALSEIDTITRRLREQYGGTQPAISIGANMRLLLDDMVHDFKTPLYVLLAATGCVLLIACLNVANLLIARGASRRKEVAIRAALGGSRWRLIREQLTETLLLAVLGGSLGLVFAHFAIRWLIGVRQDIAREEAIQMDWVAVAFTVGVTLLSALLAGLIPALSISGRGALGALQESSRSHTGGQGKTRLRKLLLSLEVALTVVLLIGAGLLLKSYQKLRSADMGCATDNILTMRLSLPEAHYREPAQRAAFFDQLLARLRALPGVSAAALVNVVPGQGYGGDNVITILEHPPLPKGQIQIARRRFCDPGYFAALQIPLVRGRTFTDQERVDKADKVIISQLAVESFFSNEDPIGKHLVVDVDMDNHLRVYEIVGVVGDTRLEISTPPQPMMYFPMASGINGRAVIMVRSQHDVTLLAIPVQQVVQSLDKDLPVAYVLTLNQLIGASMIEASFTSTLILAFAVLSLVLASVGLYGVLSYLVEQRTSEIGVRIALGAQREQVLRLVLLDGLRPALIGLGLGVLGGAMASQLIRSMLYGVRPLDAAIFVAVTIVLMLVAAASCVLPAWQASRLDPMRALRVE